MLRSVIYGCFTWLPGNGPGAGFEWLVANHSDVERLVCAPSLFGRASFGKILGLSSVPMNILLIGASPFAGLMYDPNGNYTVAFETLATLNFLGAVLLLMARKPKLASTAE